MVGLSVAILSTGEEPAIKALQRARDYLTELHLEVKYIDKQQLAANAILKTAGVLDSDLITMGGFGYRPLFQLFVGRTV